MTQRSQLLLLLMVLVGTALSTAAYAQSRDPIAELTEARRIYVPIEDMDVVIERDKEGVLIPKAKLDVLVAQAKANIEKNARPGGVSIVMTGADYAARIAGDQLLISVKAELTQFEDDWRETRLALQRLALEQAVLDDAPALVGRNPDGSVSLFTNAQGKHTLTLQLSTDLNAVGSDQAAAFSLLRAASGSLTLSLPAGKRLLVGNLQLERPAPLEQVADYKIAVGGSSGIQLRITDRAAENAADSLMFATTGYGLHVAPGEVTWHALSTVQVFGKSIDRMTFSVPSTLEIADVEATGLEGWNLSDVPNEQRTSISLTFGQAFQGTRKIAFKGVMSVETGQPWNVPPLRIDGVTSHIGQVVIQHQAGVRLRIDEATGARRASEGQKPTADMPDDLSKLNTTEFLRFDVWQPDFVLRLMTQPKQREVQAAVAAVLDVNATGLDLQAAITVKTFFAALFDVDIRLPSEWQVLSVHKDNQPLKWQLVKWDEPGVNQVRILLDSPLAAEASGQFRLVLQRDVEGWPVEAEPIVVNLPELFLPQSNLTEVAFVVRGDEDLELSAFDLKGLDAQPLNADFERLRFQSQDTHFSGKMKITRKPSRIAAQTVTFGRIDPQTVHAFLQAVVEVQGGGVRTIKVALPEATGTAIRFQCPDPRIVEQKPASPENGERAWTLQFEQRLRGQAIIVCDIELPRGDLKQFSLPQWRFVDAERQNGYIAIEAGSDQRLTIAANESDGAPLADIDPLELPSVLYRPKERVVAVYRTTGPNAVVSLSEQKFDKLPIPTAICPLLEVSSILGRSGEFQHRATFHLNVVGVQGLHVTFPTGATLWATTVDGHPVEVRRHGDVYLVPLAKSSASDSRQSAAAEVADGDRVLQIFYRSEVGTVSQFGTLTQSPPSLTVESGQRTALPVEVLEQNWDLHYPEETRLVSSHSPLEPQQPLDGSSLLGDWNSEFRVPTLEDLGWQTLFVLGTVGIIALVTYGYRRQNSLLAGIAIIAVFAVLIMLVLPAVQQSRRASRRIQGHSSDAVIDTREMGRKGEGLGFRVKEHADSDSEPAHSVPPGTEIPAQFGIAAVGQNAPAPQVGFEAGVVGRPAAAAINGNGLAGLPNLAFHAEGLLSLPMDFVAPRGSREKTFHYVGADVAATGIPLEVDYVDRDSGATMRVFTIAIVVLIGWFLRRSCVATKIGLTTLGVVIPLSLAAFVPVGWQVVMDGILLGTLAVVCIWLIRCCVLCFSCSQTSTMKTNCATAMLLIAISLSTSDSVVADDKPTLADAKSAAEAKSPFKPEATIVVPFDAGTDPLASDRIFLSHERFLELYRLANPAQASTQSAPNSGGIVEALYVMRLVPNTQNADDSVIQVSARYAVRSFVDGQLIVELPVANVSAREVKLDGQTAALIANSERLKVAVSKPGLHVVDFAFDVPARLSGATGSFTLPLLPVVAGKLTFALPQKDLSIRVNGSSTVFRRVTQGGNQSLELPIDKGGEIAITWQPQQSRDAVAAIAQVDSALAITLTDAGAAVSQGFAYRIRQGGLGDVSFSLPDSLRLQSVNGPDVGGWELQGEGAARKLRVIFRRNITDQTRLMIDTFLDAKVGTSSTAITVPQISPLEVTSEIGQVAVFAGNEFSIRAEQVDSLVQIDNEKFSTQVPVVRPNVAPQLAYRFSKRPFTLVLRASRQESQAHVTAQQAALVTAHKQQLTTRLRYNLTGAPRSSLSVTLPANFVLMDVQATGLRDWYVTKKDDGSLLTVELNGSRLGQTEVVIGGFMPSDILAASIEFPQPADATRLDSAAVLWLEEGIIGTLESFEGWRSVDPSQVDGKLLAIRPKQSPRFAFMSTATNPSAIILKLNQSTPKISADGLSMVTVTDVGVVNTLALQWQIDSATTETLSLTTPNWLAGKLDFQGPGLREATYVDAPGDRTRWTIHLRTPISGKYFAAATATLPPPTTEVEAPAIVFENDQKPLEAQRQYVLLINSSMSQLSSVDPALTESVQREDIPVVIQQDIIDSATELVRVKTLGTAPKWTRQKFTLQSGASASVNVADLTTVLSRDGTYRAQALYTIKNQSRQFLALRMPKATDLLSVFVADQPSRAVEAKLPSVSGEAVQLIALPKTSAASLAFTVKIVWRGRLSGKLPRSLKLVGEEFSVPAPQILSQQDDADYGIPVARTRWTVYLPNDFEAQAVGSISKHNLSLSTNSDNLYGNAILQETVELLGILEQSVASSRQGQERYNRKQIDVATGNLKQLEKALDSYLVAGDTDFAKNRAEVKRRLSEAERLATDQRQKAGGQSSDLKPATSPQVSLDFVTEDFSVVDRLAHGQQGSLISENEVLLDEAAKAKKDAISNFNLSLELKESVDDAKSPVQTSKSKVQAGKKANPSSEARQQLRDKNSVNIEELNEDVTTRNGIRSQQLGQQNQLDQSGKDGQVQRRRGLGAVQSGETMGQSQGGGMGGGMMGGQKEERPTPSNSSEMWGDRSQPALEQILEAQNVNGLFMVQNADQKKQGNEGFGIPVEGASAPVWKQPGGLSLDIELPMAGQKLVFTKTGGDPKLTLAIRSQESIRKLLGLAWSLVWILIGVTVLLTLRKASGLNQLRNRLPIITAVIGILGFFVLPTPINGGCFALFVIGAVTLAFQYRAPTVANE